MIILCGHGKYGEAMKCSLEMIAGVQEHVEFVDFTIDMSIADVINGYDQVIAASDGNEEVLIFCDIPGGTPANAAALVKKSNENVRVFTGLNLPMILSLALGEDVESSLDNAKEAIQEI